MIISAKATDTVYQKVLQLLEEKGIKEKEPLRQSVMLTNSTFIGYRFTGEDIEILWLANQGIIRGIRKTGDLIFLHEIENQTKNYSTTSDTVAEIEIAA